MTLVVPKPPDGYDVLAGEALLATRGLLHESEEELVASAQMMGPLPIYAVSVRASAQSASVGIQSAKPIGWRYVVLLGARSITVDLKHADPPRASVLVGDRPGNSLLKAITLAERETSKLGDYEVRHLDLNLLGDSLLWLVCRGRGRGRFFTLGDDPVEIPRRRVLRMLGRSAPPLAAQYGRASDEVAAQTKIDA